MALDKDQKKVEEDKRKGPLGYKPGDDEEQDRIFVYERFKEMKTGRTGGDTDYEDMWDEADKSYKAYAASRDSDDWRADLHIPFEYSVIRTMLQETTSAIEMPMTIPVEEQDKPTSVVFNEIIPVVLDKSNWFIKKFSIDKERFIRGTAIGKVFFRSDKRDIKEITKYDPKTGEETYKEKTIYDYDDVDIEFIDLHNFYMDEAARKIEYARDCIERQVMHIGEFRRLYGKYDNSKYVIAGGDTTMYQYYQPPQDADSNEVEVLLYTNKPLDKFVIMANDVVVHRGPIPYHHKELNYVVFYTDMDQNSFYGRGIPEIIRAMVEEANLMRNSRLDRLRLLNNPMFFVSDQIDLDDEDIVSRPGGAIPVAGPLNVDQYVKEVPISDTKIAAYKEYDQISDDIIKAVGIDYRVQGLNMGGTATEAAILKESAMKYIQMLSLLSQQYSLKRLGTLLVSTIQQFYSLKRVGRLTGEEDYKTIRLKGRAIVQDQEGQNVAQEIEGESFIKIGEDISPQDIRDSRFDIDIEAGPEPYITKPLMLSKITEAFDRLMPLPPNIFPDTGKTKIVKRYIDVNDFGIKSDDVYEGAAGPDEERNLALDENQQMDQGQPLPPTPNITPEHTLVHIQHTTDEGFGQLPPEVMDIYKQHIDGEDQMHGGGQVPPAQGSSPGQMAPPATGIRKSEVVPAMQEGGEQLGA